MAGTLGGRIFYSNDDGATWTQANIEPNAGAIVEFIAVDNLLFVMTGKGIYRSGDGGVSWQSAGEWFANDNRYVLFDKSLVSLDTYNLNVRTLDGESWSELGLSATSIFKDNNAGSTVLKFLVATGDKVFVGSDDQIFRSSDLQDWETADGGLGLTDGSKKGSPVTLKHLVSTEASLFAITSDSKDTIHLYHSIDGGIKWQPLPLPAITTINSAFTAGETLFIYGGGRLHRKVNDTWQDLGRPPKGIVMHDLMMLGDTIIIATDQGVHATNGGGGQWRKIDTGIRDTFNPRTLVVTDSLSFAVSNNGLYRSSDHGETWSLVSNDFSREPHNASDPLVVNDVAVLSDGLFVATDEGLYQGKLTGGQLGRVKFQFPVGERSASGMQAFSLQTFDHVERLAVSGNTLVVVGEGSAAQTNNQGEKWELISDGLNDGSRLRFSGGFKAVQAAGDAWLLSQGGSDSGIGFVITSNAYRLIKGKNGWEEITDGLKQSYITAFATVGDTVYAGTTATVHVDTPVSSELFKLEHAASSNTWEPLRAGGMKGDVLALWVDPKYQEVLIAGTTEGLFWSNDGGQQFTKVKPKAGELWFRQVGAINYQQGQLFVNTDAGVLYLYDRIPRGRGYAQWLDRIKQNVGLFSATVLALLLLIVLSTRLISLLLQLDIPGINQIAPVFYLSPFGRWKLYRGYRQRLRDKEGLTSDLKYGVEHYVDLPFEISGRVIEGKLSEFFTCLQRTQRVVVEADGGCGKSTLCHYLAWRCVAQGDLFGEKHLVPVVIDGLTYAGDMLNTISNTLRADRAYVNKAIIASQVEAGYLLVIFDGFSEIKETYLGAASAADLPEFIQRYPNTPLIFTSRSSLPPNVQQALKDPQTITLHNVDETTERAFLSQYLKRGAQEVDALMTEIGVRFNDLPRIPLMLKLVATVYDTKNRVPKDKASLFADYAEQVLRPEATGIDYPSGLHYAIRHLVRETYLRSGGDRGFTEDRGVELLKQIKEPLEDREIKLSPIRLLLLLTRAGLYKQVGGSLKFFHDSFESYFAARALESDFRAGKYELLKACAGNERLDEPKHFLREILAETGDQHKFEEFLYRK